jgi:hypothetical protein
MSCKAISLRPWGLPGIPSTRRRPQASLGLLLYLIHLIVYALLFLLSLFPNPVEIGPVRTACARHGQGKRKQQNAHTYQHDYGLHRLSPQSPCNRSIGTRHDLVHSLLPVVLHHENTRANRAWAKTIQTFRPMSRFLVFSSRQGKKSAKVRLTPGY